jgi:hypothetical protein
VWSLVLNHLRLHLIWSGTTLSISYTRWLAQASAPKSLPALVSWQIWNARNRAIFDPVLLHQQVVFQKVLVTFNWKQPLQSPPKLNVCDLHFWMAIQ